MDDQQKLKNAFKRLQFELADSLAPFYVVLIIITVATIVIVAKSGLLEHSDSILFYLCFIPMAVGMFYAHKKMVKDPLLRIIDRYITEVSQSNLSGDELLNQKLLPTKGMISRFNKYNIELQKTAIGKLYHGISHLDFSIAEADTPEEYKQTLSLIKSAKPNQHENA